MSHEKKHTAEAKAEAEAKAKAKAEDKADAEEKTDAETKADTEDKADAKEQAAEDSNAGAHGLSAKGFVWHGTGTYDKLSEVTISDDDDKMDWFGHETGARATVSVDQSQPGQIYGGGTYRFEFETPEGETVNEDMLTFYAQGTGWVIVPEADSKFTEGARVTRLHGWQDTGGVDYGDIVCFAAPSLILTGDGYRPVRELRAGDMVQTADNGLCPIRWIGSSLVTPARRLREDLHPVKIRANAFGPGLPAHDLWVSPQHRFCLGGARLQTDFALDQALVPALSLVDGHAVQRPRAGAPLAYYHLLFDRHELVLADGLVCESLYPGRQAMRSVSCGARREIERLFPALAVTPDAVGPLVRPCLSRSEAARLSATAPVGLMTAAPA